MARRSSSKKTTEQLMSRICGLRPNGDAVLIHVYKKGKSARLSGPNGSHLVHPSNESGSPGWMREAVLVWNLTEVHDEHPIYTDHEESTDWFAGLRAKGDELKRTQKV